MSDEDTASANDVEDKRLYRTTTFADRYAIFMTCKATMVNGHLKNVIQGELARLLGISRGTVSLQWTRMNYKLAPLLVNQDDECHPAIIQDNSKMLFGDDLSLRKKSKYK
jgi:hypothetical protein